MKGGECYKGRSCARYFISGHGCYLPEYKINIDPKITLDFFSYEDECLQYNNAYIETFCTQSQYKRVKGYTPEFSIKNKYYESVFPWLEDCEKKFGFKNLKGYKTIRIYGYLAERYASFWFNKYTKSLSWPINFFDTSKIR